MEEKNHILVIDDDNRLRRLLHQYLKENGFIVSEAANPEEARKMMDSFLFDILILDVMMPGENGFCFAKSLREKGIQVPILMLTAMGELQDRIEGLESGVDDYLSKPFDPKELLLRLNSILRRAAMVPEKEKTGVLSFGSCLYDVDRAELSSEGHSIPLTQVERDLLRVLVDNLGKEVSRLDLAMQTGTENERTVDVQINRLRKKIEQSPKNPRYLQTVRGKGYILLPQ